MDEKTVISYWFLNLWVFSIFYNPIWPVVINILHWRGNPERVGVSLLELRLHPVRKTRTGRPWRNRGGIFVINLLSGAISLSLMRYSYLSGDIKYRLRTKPDKADFVWLWKAFLRLVQRNLTKAGVLEIVSLYHVSRVYGGPEEGGWWYDWRERISTKFLWFTTRDRLDAVRFKMAADETDATTLPGEYITRIEMFVGEFQSTEPMHYC